MTPWEKGPHRVGYALLALLAAAAPARSAAFSKSARGTTGAQFLELPASARAAAMGSAQGAAVDDATALDYNPAGLAEIDGGDGAFMHAEHFEGISFDYLAVAQRLGQAGTLGLGLRYLSPGKLEEVDNTGAATGSSFAPRDLAAAIGFGRAFGTLELGAAGRLISSKIHNSATSFSGDLGARNRWGPLALSLGVANMGPGLKYRERSDPLPLTVRMGSSFDLSDWVFALDIVAPRGTTPHPAIGAEYTGHFLEQLRFAIRVGYDGRLTQSRLGSIAGIAFGGGVEAGRMRFDYAAASYGDLGLTHRLSAGIRWGGESAPDWRRSERKGTTRVDSPPEDKDLRRIRYNEKMGRSAYKEGDCQQAKKSYAEAIRLAAAAEVEDPIVADAYAGMARCLLEDGQDDYAERYFKKALGAGPDLRTRTVVEKELKALRRRK